MATAAFDRRDRCFADRMMFPKGPCGSDGSLYVGAPPEHLEAYRYRRRRRGRIKRVGVGSRARRSTAAPNDPPRARTWGLDGWILLVVRGAISRSQRTNGRAEKPFVTPRGTYLPMSAPTGSRDRAGHDGRHGTTLSIVVFTPAAARGSSRPRSSIAPMAAAATALIHAIYGGNLRQDL